MQILFLLFLHELYFLFRESPQLVAVLKEMKEGLDTVRIKVQALTAKVLCSVEPIRKANEIFCV